MAVVFCIKGPESREQGSPWGNEGQGARGRGRRQEAEWSGSPAPRRARAGCEQEAWLPSTALEPCGRTR